MTIREAMADWLTGGALTEARLRADLWRGRNDRLLSNFRLSVADTHQMMDALQAIAAMETPGANATVRRMAARARKAME